MKVTKPAPAPVTSPTPGIEHGTSAPGISYTAHSPVIEYVALVPAVTDCNACSSDRVRGTCTCRCPCSACASDRARDARTFCRIYRACSSDRVRGYLTRRCLCSVYFRDRIRVCSTCRHLCSSSDRICVVQRATVALRTPASMTRATVVVRVIGGDEGNVDSDESDSGDEANDDDLQWGDALAGRKPRKPA